MNELLVQTNSLYGFNLGHAIDLIRMAKTHLKNNRNLNHTLAHRFAMSSIIHAYAGIESVINYFGFELFFNEDSPRFVPQEKREFLLNRMLRSWDTVPFIEKLSFILFYASKQQLPPKLENQLREVNNLRNWLVHGFSYKTTFLLDPTPKRREGSSVLSYDVLDIDESIDWAKKFPNTKFKPLPLLDIVDAIIVIVIVFDTLKILSDCMEQPFVIETCVPKYNLHLLFEDKFNVQEIIETT